MDHFLHPRNMGEMVDANGVGTVGNPICVLRDTLILANNKIAEIGDLEEGKKVLSHDGCYHTILKTHKRDYSGDLYEIRTHNLGTTILTPEHHILALKMFGDVHKYNAFKKNKALLDWHEASLLEKGDFLLYPIPKETVDTSFLDIEITKSRWDFRSFNLPKRLKVTEDFLRLGGYYLAEGYVSTRVTAKAFGFVFGKEEQEFVKDTIKLMEKYFCFLPSDVIEKSNSINIVYCRSQLVDFFQNLFGKGALNKFIPHWITLLPPEKQKGLIRGLWRGDGYISKRKKVAKFVTISQQLAYQLRSLLLRQKIIFSFLVTSKKGIHKKSYSIYIKEDQSLKKLASIVGEEIDFPVNKKSPHKTWFDENYYYTPIYKIERFKYKGEVCNLKVEGSASYVTNSATLHNCGDVMKMFLKIEDETIKDVKFQTLGCGAAIATSSMATEMIKGKPVKDALELTNQAIVEALDGLPKNKIHCSVLAAEAVKKAIEDYKLKISKS